MKKGIKDLIAADRNRAQTKDEEPVVVETKAAEIQQALTLDDLRKVLPQKLVDQLKLIEKRLEDGKIESAIETLRKIKSEMMSQPSKPVDLYLEAQVRRIREKRHREETKDPEVQKFFKDFVRKNNDESLIGSVSWRQIAEWENLGKNLHRHKDYMPNSNACSQIFVINSGPKLKVVVDSENLKHLCDFLRLSLDLGGFPLIDPNFNLDGCDPAQVKELKYLLSVQNELVVTNSNGCRSGLLHLLADQPHLTAEQLTSLDSYLQPDSMQRINLLQPDFQSRTPLTIACLRSNTDFILAVLAKADFCGLLSRDPEKVVDPLHVFLSPPALDQLSKNRTASTQHMQVLSALHANFERSKDSKQLLADLVSENLRLLKSLDPYSNKNKKQATFNQMKSVYPDIDEETLWSSFPLLFKSQKWLCDQLISSAITALPVADQIMVALFGSGLRCFGFPIIQLAAYSPLQDLRLLCDTSPGLGFILKSQVSLLLKYQSSVQNFRKLQISRSLFQHSNTCYLSAFKLAVLFQPEAQDLQTFFLDESSNNDPMYQLENLALIGESLGIDTPQFKRCFEQQPWLKCQKPNLNSERQELTPAHQEFQSLLIRMAAVLIQNQAPQLFGQFLLSLRNSCLNSKLVNHFLFLCRIHFQPPCFVPLFAICANYSLKVSVHDDQAATEDRFITQRYEAPHLSILKVSQEDVSTTLNVWLKLMNYETFCFKSKKTCKLRVQEFFESVEDGSLADELVSFITDNQLEVIHFSEIDAKLFQVLRFNEKAFNSRKETALSSILSRFDFFRQVFKHCSVTAIEKFLKVSFEARVSNNYTHGFFPLYLLNAVIATTIDAEKNDKKAQIYNLDSKHMEGNKRRATNLLPAMLANAINFPLQAQMMQESKVDQRLAQELANRLGVDNEFLNAKVDEALSQLRQIQSKRYTFDQIAEPRVPSKSNTAQPLKKPKTAPMIKIQVMPKQDRDNPIQQAVYHQKFKIVQRMMDCFIKRASFDQLLVFAFWLYGNVSQSNLHRNLRSMVQEENGMEYPTVVIQSVKILLPIMKRLFDSGKLEGLVDKLTKVPTDPLLSIREVQTIYDGGKPLIVFFVLFRQVEYYLRKVFKDQHVNTFYRDELASLNNALFSMLGSHFGTFLGLDFALNQIKFRLQEVDTDDRPDFDDLFARSDRTMVTEIVGAMTSWFTKRITSFVQKEQLLLWRVFDQGLINAFIEDFEKAVDALTADNLLERGQFGDANLDDGGPTLVAFWFSLMSPEQIEKCLAKPVSWFLMRSNLESLTVFFDRQDLPKQILTQVLTKALQINLVRNADIKASGFSDQIRQEVEKEDNVSKLMHIVIMSRLIQRGRLQHTDLPPELLQACKVTHLVRALICCPNCPEESEQDFLVFIRFLLSKVKNSNEFLQRYDRPFTFLCTHLPKCEKVFAEVEMWIRQTGKQSVLDFELSHDLRSQESETTIGWLLHTSRNSVVLKMKQYVSGIIWEHLINQRSVAFSAGSRKPWNRTDLRDKDNFQNGGSSRYDSEEETYLIEEQENFKKMTPFFIALNLNQFEMACLLAPQEFSDLSVCEWCLIAQKLESGINPLTVDSAANKAKLRSLQDWLDQSGCSKSTQDFPFLQLSLLLPGLASKLVKAAEDQRDEILAQELAICEPSSTEASLAQRYFATNPIHETLIKQGSQDAYALKQMIELGVFGKFTGQVLSETIALKVNKDGLAQTQEFFVELIKAFGNKTPQAFLIADTQGRCKRATLAYFTEKPIDFDADEILQTLLVEQSSKLLLPDDLAVSHSRRQFLDIVRAEIPADVVIKVQDEICAQIWHPVDEQTQKPLHEQSHIRFSSSHFAVLKHLLNCMSQHKLTGVFTRRAQREDALLNYLRGFLSSLTDKLNPELTYNKEYSIPYNRIRELMVQTSKEIQLTVAPSTLPFAAIWFSLLAHYKIDSTIVKKFDLQAFSSTVQDLSFDSLEQAFPVAKMMLEWTESKLKARTENGKRWLSDSVEWRGKLTTTDTEQLAFYLALQLEIFKKYRTEAFAIAAKELFTEAKDANEVLSVANVICGCMTKIEDGDELLLGLIKDLLSDLTKARNLNIDIHSVETQTFGQLATLTDKVKKLMVLFSEHQDAYRVIQVQTDLPQPFDLREEESKSELSRVTLLLDKQVLTNDEVFKEVIGSFEQKETAALAKAFCATVQEKLLIHYSPFQFKSIKLCGNCPPEFAKALKEFSSGEHMNSIILQFTLGMFSKIFATHFDQQTLAYLQDCDVQVQFVAEFSTADLFIRTLKDYCDRKKILTVSLHWNGITFSLVPESYLPLLHRALITNHRAYLTKLKPGQPDVPVSIDYSGLTPLLAKSLSSVPHPLTLFSKLKEEYSDNTVVKQLQDLFDELRIKVISLQGCFAAKNSKKVSYNQLRGVLVQFDPNGACLQFETVDEEVVEKESEEYIEWSMRVPKAPSPFETNIVPKNYNSKMARLTVKFR